jgi:hypothetical protein
MWGLIRATRPSTTTISHDRQTFFFGDGSGKVLIAKGALYAAEKI